jgi:hypothetical protein
MIRNNTSAEIRKINELIQSRSNKLVYYNAKSNPYKSGWWVRPAKDINCNINGSVLFYTVKHPGGKCDVNRY